MIDVCVCVCVCVCVLGMCTHQTQDIRVDDELCTCCAGIPLKCDVDNEWIYVNGSCFKIFTDRRTWHDAK